MEKISFQDATLTTQAYVTIDDKNYNVIDSVYEGGTDLNAETFNQMQNNIENAIKLIHPIGSIYMTTVATNPSEIFGFGTWELWGEGRVPVGVDINNPKFEVVEKTGGEENHTLTVDEMPSHAHSNMMFTMNSIDNNYGYARGGTYSGRAVGRADTSQYNVLNGVQNIQNTGGSVAHNNLQPYITCYMFKRIS